MNYEERMKERERIISEIDATKQKLQDLKEQISNPENDLDTFEKKKSKLEKRFKDLETKYSEDGIPVPEGGEYEIENGLSGMNRDINFKLTEYLDEEQIRQVFTF
jgi:predicted nuclease with TOPRIM domain